LEEGEKDFTIMRIVVEGLKDGKKTKHTYDLYDEYDAATKIHSMARTTGYAATTAADMIVKGVFTNPGITVPELLGAHSQTSVDFMLEGLRQQGVCYRYQQS
jgi:saccharopine dehydrogenase-like NADP-dependent oxidoreductase